MKPFALSDLPASLQAQALNQLKGCPHPSTVAINAPNVTERAPRGTPRVRQNAQGLNKTEQAFKDYLCAARLNPLTQAITLKLGNGVRYTPDFVTVEEMSFPPICAYEVKGFMRDDAAVKLKVAASAYPWIKFFLACRNKQSGGWNITPILP